MIHVFTIAINFIALIVAIWLGLYLVTRRLHHPEVWLMALAIWSMGGYFLNQLLALYPPPAPPVEIRTWLFHLMLFWPRKVFEMGWKGWLQGWLPVYSIIFWYHATLYMLPGPFSRNRLSAALLGYVAALAGILVIAHNSDAWVNIFEDPIYTTSIAYPFSLLYGVGFVIFAGLSISNLARIARSTPASMPRGQLQLFICAILLAGATGLIDMVSLLLNAAIPQALTAFLLLMALLLAGTGISNYISLLGAQEDKPMPQVLEQPVLTGDIAVNTVELALRNLHNYAYLADSPLSNLRLVGAHLESGKIGIDTHIDCGKAVSDVLSEAVLKLKPCQGEIPNTPPRTWYPYIILWDAYHENKPNLKIMSRLYISEGTFNRTRKAAICSVARIIMEMEAHVE